MSDERIQRELHKRAIGAYSLWMHSGDDPAACECNSDYFVAGYQSRQAEIDRLTAELAECKKDAALSSQDAAIQQEPAELARVRNEAIEECKRFIDNGSFMHDQAPTRLFANEVIKGLDTLKTGEAK